MQLPGSDHRASEITQGASPEKLKAEAERWLEEFISSLGAIFPGDDENEFSDEDEEPHEDTPSLEDEGKTLGSYNT